MNRKINFALACILLLVVLIGSGYYYVFKSGHRDISKETATANFQAPELQYEFKKLEADTSIYADQVVKVTGHVTSIENKTIVLDNMVQVDLLVVPDPLIQNGKSISIKGRCVGYDDLLEVVKIDQASFLTE